MQNACRQPALDCKMQRHPRATCRGQTNQEYFLFWHDSSIRNSRRMTERDIRADSVNAWRGGGAMFVLRIVERDSLRRHLRWRERVARLGRVYGRTGLRVGADATGPPPIPQPLTIYDGRFTSAAQTAG